MKLIPLVVIAVVALGLLLAACNGRVRDDEREPPVSTKQVAVAGRAFAVDLYNVLRERDGNLFFSPYSLSTALAMTCAGARGPTADQMQQVLHLSAEGESLHLAYGALTAEISEAQKEKYYQLRAANALWGQEGYDFLADYKRVLKRHYAASLFEADFAGAGEVARGRINRWAESATEGKITDLIPPGILTRMTRLVLTNAIYFKGQWAEKFPPERTREAPFHLAAGREVTVPMMGHMAEFRYAERDGFQVVELPYAGRVASMVIVLPRAVDGLPALEAELTAEKLDEWTSGLRRRRVAVHLPRFETGFGFQASDALKQLGMADAFDASQADFSGINGRRDLFIQAVIHKAFVSVNEEGTEAAAATGVGVGVTAAPQPPVMVEADHPFLFLIRHERTGAILFMGRLVSPTE